MGNYAKLKISPVFHLSFSAGLSIKIPGSASAVLPVFNGIRCAVMQETEQYQVDDWENIFTLKEKIHGILQAGNFRGQPARCCGRDHPFLYNVTWHYFSITLSTLIFQRTIQL
jgi:hypothetical protein